MVFLILMLEMIFGLALVVDDGLECPLEVEPGEDVITFRMDQILTNFTNFK